MPVFKQSNKTLTSIREVKVQLEKDLQGLTEENLETVFGLLFVSTEFQLNSLRIDTLAFDPETNAFVIIEYKRDKSFSVVDQGFAYLALMLNNKADFILEYNEKMQTSLRRDDVDWSQSRVIFLAHSFTKHQREAINFKDLPIELWEVRKYEDSLISYNPLKALHTSESIKTVSKDETVSKVSGEVRSYSLEDHIKESWTKSLSLFMDFEERLNELDERFEQKINKHYIAFKIAGANICEVVVQKQGLKLYLDAPFSSFEDPSKTLEDCSDVGHWATGSTRFFIQQPDDISLAVSFVRSILSTIAN